MFHVEQDRGDLILQNNLILIPPLKKGVVETGYEVYEIAGILSSFNPSRQRGRLLDPRVAESSRRNVGSKRE